MNALTRRRFLIASGVAGGGALAAGATAMSLGQLMRTARTATQEELLRASRKIVLVTLYGGNDGLNTIIPFTHPKYHELRPELAYKEDDVLPITGELAMNKCLPGLKTVWDSGHLAIINGVGYPHPERSHFRSMDIWQTASPRDPAYTGWVGRWLDGTNASPAAAVTFEPVLPPLLAGETRAGACVPAGGIALPPGITQDIVAALGRVQNGENELQARAATAFANLITAKDVVRAEIAEPAAEDVSILTTGPGTTSSIADQMNLIASCIELGVPTQIYSASLDGFDTHAEEISGHEFLLKRLDKALADFQNRMEKTEQGKEVVVVVYSEFGRRVRANASDGTDHGTAGPVLVLGPRVRGGQYGQYPSLWDLPDGDLRATMDMRDVYGTLLASHLGVDPGKYLFGWEPTILPLVNPIS